MMAKEASSLGFYEAGFKYRITFSLARAMKNVRIKWQIKKNLFKNSINQLLSTIYSNIHEQNIKDTHISVVKEKVSLDLLGRIIKDWVI